MLLFGTCSDKLKLIKSGKNGITITKNVKSGWASVYGKEWIQSTENRSISWEVALKRISNSYDFPLVGLVPNQHHGDTGKNIANGDTGYVWRTNGLLSVDGIDLYDTGAHELNVGETITITLDLSQSRIVSKKGNEEKIICDKIKRDNNTFYRFAVTLRYKNCSLTVTRSGGDVDEEDQKKDVKYKWINIYFVNVLIL